MTLDKAGFVQGWLFAKDAPKEVRDAIGAVIETLKANYSWPDEVKAIQDVMNMQAGEIADLEHSIKELNKIGIKPVLASDDERTLPAPELKSVDKEVNKSGLVADGAHATGHGSSEWTPERRAAASERARNRPPKIPDGDLAAVKADFDAGMSFGAMGMKWNCSGQTVKNFLTKHGIDCDRYDRTAGKSGGRPALTEEEIQLIIYEKAKGTPSKEIGEMIDRSQHAVDVKYAQLKNAGRVPEEHLTPEALSARKQRQNELVSEKMTEYHAGKQAEPEEPCASDGATAITVRSPAARWKPSPLSTDDWPDIQRMLATSRSRESIASDFDVPVEDLNEFIEEQLQAARARRGEPPGESLPPSPGMAGTAA